MTAPTEDFDGCARECRKAGQHTLVWGRCEFAEEPPRADPAFGFWRVMKMEDGYDSLVQASLPLTAVLPWAVRLTVDERHQMLEEATDGDDPAAIIQRWQRVAERRNPVTVNFSATPPSTTGAGYGPGHVQSAYEQGRLQGRYEAGG